MKRRFLLLTTLAAILMAGCSGTNSGTDTTVETINTQETNAAEAMILPAFSMQNSEGNTVSLQSLKGKKVFVNLWASWCPPCRREMPSIEKLYKSVDKNKVAFVMLALDDRFELAKQYLAKTKLQLPLYYPAENLPALFNVDGIPATFIFDEKGELIKRVDGSDDYDREKYRALLR
jgi:thiol-disulfide isomerase/thioredoxin